ncbi:MAG: hypothetical protein JXR37_34750 [Kiritimatiellae bacterium]|nr:hypothetical protein [Kiritimatiellia bacterium]
MTEPIDVRPIGVIHTPYRDHADIPIQGRFKADAKGWLEADSGYEPGLKDLDGFTQASLLVDIKPYVPHFDCFTDAECGWIEKHFAAGDIPEKAVRKSPEESAP